MEEHYDALRKIVNISTKFENIFFRDYYRSVELPYDLNKTHFSCMLMLKYYGPSSMGFISNLLSLEKGSFTIVSKKLIDVGFISKVNDDVDKRSYILALTNTGEDFMDKVRAEHKRYTDSKLERLNKPSLREFNKMLEKLDIITNEL